MRKHRPAAGPILPARTAPTEATNPPDANARACGRGLSSILHLTSAATDADIELLDHRGVIIIGHPVTQHLPQGAAVQV